MIDELFTETSETIPPPRKLPHPNHERWKPLRSGVLNIFKYDEEEFWFEDGRLLLRGNNGAGKSRILALQLPFLLDGEMSPHRVEPDGDAAKRMDWNLLMNRHEQRLGYTWIEFGRKDADGREHFLTLGCGMHARKGAGIPPNSRWFFVTSQRIGETLSLVAENRVPLNRERLGVALGDVGEIYRSARDYRAAVDRALFGLGSRYEPLIELLLQLRKPQIMRDFKEDDLSRLLSEALPPLSERLIEGVSVSFRSLETDRQQLADLTDARRSVETFLVSFQHYIRIAVRRRATDVRTTHSRYENAQRMLNRLAEQSEENTTALLTAEAEESRLREAFAAGQATERTLKDSPEMKSAGDLERAMKTRDEQSQWAGESEESARSSERSHRRLHGEYEEVQAQVVRETNTVAQRLSVLIEVGEKAGLSGSKLPSQDGDVNAVTQKGLDITIQERGRGIPLVREKNNALSGAVTRRKEYEARFEQRSGDLARYLEVEAEAKAARETTLESLVIAIYEWERSLEVLPFEAGEDWRILLENWLDSMDAPAPLMQRIDYAYEPKRQSLSDEASQWKRTLGERTVERTRLVQEIETLRAGQHTEPPVSYTRSLTARTDRPGAPLWKLCGFRDDVSSEDRAGFEAALEAAGLLDAWVTPDGVLIDPASGDTYFAATDGGNREGLNRILQPESESAEMVRQILGCIGFWEHDGPTWICADGRWRHGLLQGVWSKPTAEYLGHAAREEARHRRLAELEAILTGVDAEIEDIRLKLRLVSEQTTRLTQERNNAPTITLLQRAAHKFESAVNASAEARARLDEADRQASHAREVETRARAERDGDAADLGLAEWKEPEDLIRLEKLLNDVRLSASLFWSACLVLSRVKIGLEQAAYREQEARESLGKSQHSRSGNATTGSRN